MIQKAIRNKICKLLTAVGSEIVKRESVLSRRSEEWAESPTGEKFQEDMDALRDVSDMLDEALSHFEWEPGEFESLTKTKL